MGGEEWGRGGARHKAASDGGVPERTEGCCPLHSHAASPSTFACRLPKLCLGTFALKSMSARYILGVWD